MTPEPPHKTTVQPATAANIGREKGPAGDVAVAAGGAVAEGAAAAVAAGWSGFDESVAAASAAAA